MTASDALLVTRDESLLDDLLRLAAAAGVTPDVARDGPAALRAWAAASVVLVGTDQLAAVALRGPVRRTRVHVVGHGPMPDDAFRLALQIGAEQAVELPGAEALLVELLTDVADGGDRRALTIGVVGGSGGAGATTFAGALAMTAASPAHPAVLLDADPLGGGADRVVGFDGLEGIRWDSLADGAGRFGSRPLRDALPRRGGLAVLTWAGEQAPVDAFTMREVVSAAQRGHDTVVIDLPRHHDPVAAEALTRCDHVVLVATLTVPGVAAAGRVVSRLRQEVRELHLVTRGHRAALAGEQVSRALGVRLVATMPDQRRLEEAVDLGLGPVRSRRGPLARAARTTLAALASAPVRVG